jgi:3',5'-cyclic AMP phosphodiesterase CpdA
VPGHHEGYLCAERLRWLEDRLVEAPARPTLIFCTTHRSLLVCGSSIRWG